MARPLWNSRRKAMHAVIARRYGLSGPLQFKSPPPRLPEAPAFEAPLATAADALPKLPRMAGPPTADISRPDLLTLQRAPFAVRVLNHLTYGATSTSLAEFNALGANDTARLTAFVDQQLNPAAINDSALDTRLANAGYSTLSKSLTQLWADHILPDPAYDIRMRPAWEAQRATLVRAVHSKRQLQELVIGFWHNHFNVMATDFDSGPVFMHYHRDVIRANALGNFRTMLEAVAQSTSMLYFLDNASNTRSGPNENFARELLELHTFGA